MIKFKNWLKTLPSLLLSLAIAITIWIIAVTSGDPTETRAVEDIPLQVIGQDETLLITSNLQPVITLQISAPISVWDEVPANDQPATAVIDLSGLQAGDHTVPVQVALQMTPARLILQEPEKILITLEELLTESKPITINKIGEPSVGFSDGTPILEQPNVVIRGAKSLVEKVAMVQADADIRDLRETLKGSLILRALDAEGNVIQGVAITPAQVAVEIPIEAQTGYRNVVVKVLWSGQPATGYRLTSLSVNPPAVTVFSANPQQVENLAGYVETFPLNLSGVREGFETQLVLNLPLGVVAIDQNYVNVLVGIAAIESSVALNNIQVDVIGLEEGLEAQVSPQVVSLLISGPATVLEKISVLNVKVKVDLTGVGVGTWQKVPIVEIGQEGAALQSVVPNTLEVIVSSK